MNARFSELTTFRLGGPCREIVRCETPEELAEAVRALSSDALLIGGGSNLLVADEGVDAPVIRYASFSPRVEIADGFMTVSAAAELDAVVSVAVAEGWEGLTHCAGIPGTVGGAIAGNAGAFGEQIGDVVISVELMDREGRRRVAPGSALAFNYRASSLQSSRDIIVSAKLRVRKADGVALRARREEILALRAEKHPDWRKIPTAGSFFKNIEPSSSAARRQAAGWFLEQAGAKAMRVGGAHTFERHANIIVADSGCTAKDVYRLSLQMTDAVRKKFGISLQREVRLIGDFDER